MNKGRLFAAIGAVVAIGLASAFGSPRAAAQEFVQRHWISGVEAKIVPAPVWITGSNLGQVNEGTSYSIQLTATGADSYAAGGLPAGFTVSTSGLLSGVAPMVEDSTDLPFSVSATNAGGNAARAFTLRVIDTSVPAPEWVSTADLGNFIGGSPVSIQLAASGATNYSLVSGSLPSGVTLNSSGLISGTAPTVTADADFSLRIRASNDGGEVERDFVLHVLMPQSGTQVFTTPGTYSFAVPNGVTSILVKAWGAGGGGGATTRGFGSGAAEATVSVTPGQSLSVYVARGGAAGSNRGTGIGGSGWNSGVNGGTNGGGGGSTAVIDGSTPLVVAAGGKGAGGAAGGGTNYVNSVRAQGSLYPGSGPATGNSGDPDWIAGFVGSGGMDATYTGGVYSWSGANGEVVIRWGADAQ